mmetsp:Transcript_9173/g.16139  ORF Transcript_9173/g.16139 Transcript_9173/m.16139 type:complete len:229 (+) Transcript_9173:1422-2108(+)
MAHDLSRFTRAKNDSLCTTTSANFVGSRRSSSLYFTCITFRNWSNANSWNAASPPNVEPTSAFANTESSVTVAGRISEALGPSSVEVSTRLSSVEGCGYAVVSKMPPSGAIMTVGSSIVSSGSEGSCVMKAESSASAIDKEFRGAATPLAMKSPRAMSSRFKVPRGARYGRPSAKASLSKERWLGKKPSDATAAASRAACASSSLLARSFFHSRRCFFVTWTRFRSTS